MKFVYSIFVFILFIALEDIRGINFLVAANGLTYPIVATGQVETFDNETVIAAPKKGEAFYGQDAQFTYNEMSYTDNGDGTISDNITGLMWQKGFTVMGYQDALKELKKLNKSDKYNDWRLPTIKELYSIMNFNGGDVSDDMGGANNNHNHNSRPNMNSGNRQDFGNGNRSDVNNDNRQNRQNPNNTSRANSNNIPFIDTNYFDFEYGSNGERIIDTQLLSSTIYTSTTMGTNKTMFGLNIADGRIKGYPLFMARQPKKYTVRFVRGNNEYGINKFVDNKDNTIIDEATGLMWSKDDSIRVMNWQSALDYVQSLNDENYLGYSDWRLPNAKELHSIVDYSRSPKATSSAAIDPIFNTSRITAEDGSLNYGEYWTSTTHKNIGRVSGRAAVYISFGESMGFLAMRNERGGSQGGGGNRPQGGSQQGGGGRSQGGGSGGGMGQQQGGGNRPQGSGGAQQGGNRGNVNMRYTLMDVHGAGAQRSDPKTGDPSDYPNGLGPQGDTIRIYNLVRPVRTAN